MKKSSVKLRIIVSIVFYLIDFESLKNRLMFFFSQEVMDRFCCEFFKQFIKLSERFPERFVGRTLKRTSKEKFEKLCTL